MSTSSWWLISLVLTAVIVILSVVIFRRLQKIELQPPYLQVLADSLPDMTWVKDKEARFVIVNKKFSEVFGLLQEEVLGKTDADIACQDLVNIYFSDDNRTLARRTLCRREVLISAGDELEIWVETTVVPVFDANKDFVGIAGIARDISERKHHEKQIRHLAYHDTLTGLPNRLLLEVRFQHLLSQHDADGEELVVMFIDLDNFKVINDTVSHNAGDMVLIEIAARLRKATRQQDIVARIGGDEFIVVMSNTRKHEATTSAERIQKALRAPISVDGDYFESHMSIGVSGFPYDGTGWRELIEKADVAMYFAKQTGKNKVAHYTRSLAERSQRKVADAHQLEGALTRGEFLLHYQPKVEILSGRIVGLEALLRWQCKEAGRMLLPEEFLPLAERSGVIVGLGDWILDQVLEQLSKWQFAGIKIPVSINITALQVEQKTFHSYLQERLRHHGICGEMLAFDVSESMLMDNAEIMSARLKQFVELGIGISVDDFGSGYSRLADLVKLPLQGLKLDSTFIHDIHQHTEHRQIVMATVAMAKSLGLCLVVEGVDTREELRELLVMGVDQARGALFDPALSPEALQAQLGANWCYKTAVLGTSRAV